MNNKWGVLFRGIAMVTTPTFETFDYAYELQGSFQSGFTLQDDIPITKKVDPVAGTWRAH